MTTAAKFSAGSPDILIVGAGPVGLSAALELARRGIHSRIIDRADGITDHSKAVGINARTLELLEASGVSERLIAKGTKVLRAHLHSGHQRIAELDFSAMRHRYPFMLALAQSETEAVLQTRLAENGIHVEWQTELTDLEADDVGAMAVMKTPERGEIRQVFAHVLGADGSRSRVRQALGIRFEGSTYPEEWNLVDLRMDTSLDPLSANLFLMGAGQVLFIITIGEGRFRLIANVPDALSLLPKGTNVSEVLWSSDFIVHLKQVDTYRKGVAFLAGDAAHVHSPAGGRGMNLGIEDACSFAECLAEGRLDAYSDARMIAGHRVINESDKQYRAASIRSPLLARMRDKAIALFLSVPWLHRKLVEELAGIMGTD